MSISIHNDDCIAVHLVSTYRAVEPLESVIRWDSKLKAKSYVSCPEIVKNYNAFMGGVDLCDMYHALYRIDKRSKRWYIRIVYFLFSVCLTNAWLLYKINNKTKMPLREFIISVSDSLMRSGKNLKKPVGRPKQNAEVESGKTAYKKIIVSDDIRFDNVGHWVSCDKKRNRCKFCEKSMLTNTKCTKCDVFLCLTTDRNCFYDFHNQNN